MYSHQLSSSLAFDLSNTSFYTTQQNVGDLIMNQSPYITCKIKSFIFFVHSIHLRDPFKYLAGVFEIFLFFARYFLGKSLKKG